MRRLVIVSVVSFLAGTLVSGAVLGAGVRLAPGAYDLDPGTYTFTVPGGAPSPTPTSTPSPTAAPTPSPTPTAAPSPTSTPAPTATAQPSSTPTSAPPSGGLERKFPRNPLTAGAVLDSPGEWADFTSLNTQDLSRAFVAVTDAGRVVARNTNDGTWSERHSNLGTGRSENYGAVVCSAFGVKADATEYPWPTQWQIVWQAQQTGSPMISIEAKDGPDGDTLRDEWVLRLRSSSGDQDTRLADIELGRWSYFVACYRLDNAAGWAKVWHAYDSAPDVTAPPTHERTGFDTWQWSTTSSQGHQTLGMYGASSTQVHQLRYWGYGRAATPERAVELADLP